MGKCNITTIKFKEFPLRTTTDLSTDTIPSTPPTYNHVDENEVFVVGYQYKTDTNCHEVKIRLADIMNGEGGGGGGDVELVFRYNIENGHLEFSTDGGDTWQDGCYLPSDEGSNIENCDVYPIHSGDSYAEIVGDTLNLYLRLDGEQGPPGQDGADGTTIDLYSVEVTPQGFTAKSGYSGSDNASSCSYFEVIHNSASGVAWKRFNPSSGAYESCDKPVPATGSVVEIGPADATLYDGSVAWNLTYGVFGAFKDNVYHFYLIRRPETTGKIRCSVKIYNNIGQASSSAALHPGTAQ